MKVVLFCGGMGMRLREFSEAIPKPMVPIGPRPIIWHLMKYYAHYGHKDFILCLGWQGHVIKDYFLNYNECVSNDFVLKHGDRVQLLRSDISDWTITFVDTGLHSNLGQRLTAVRPYVEGEECFLANYSDGLTDLPLPALIDRFHESDSIATFLGVRPRLTFHLMDSDDDGWVSRMTPIASANLWMNAGFFALRQEIFSYIRDREELVVEPFRRLIDERRLTSHKYDGFWASMDTYKEKQTLDDLYHRSDAPWVVWGKDAIPDTSVIHMRTRVNGQLSREPQPKMPTREAIELAATVAPASPK